MPKYLLALAALLLLGGGQETPAKVKKQSKTNTPNNTPQQSSKTAPSGRSVLIVGDSLSSGAGTPGGRLAKLLRAEGHDVEVNAMGSRRGAGWLRGSTIIKDKDGNVIKKENGTAEQQLSGKTYDVIIMFLGTNDAAGDAISRDKGVKESEIASHNELAKLLSKHATKVIAISPPAFSESIKRGGKYGTYDNTINDVSKDYYLRYKDLYGNVVNAFDLTDDIREPSQGRSKDLVHFNKEGADMFAERLANEIKPKLKI